MKPSENLFFPTKNGEWLRDSQGKPRVYKSAKSAVRNLERFEYDTMLIYTLDDFLGREDFEKEVSRHDKRQR